MPGDRFAMIGHKKRKRTSSSARRKQVVAAKDNDESVATERNSNKYRAPNNHHHDKSHRSSQTAMPQHTQGLPRRQRPADHHSDSSSGDGTFQNDPEQHWLLGEQLQRQRKKLQPSAATCFVSPANEEHGGKRIAMTVPQANGFNEIVARGKDPAHYWYCSDTDFLQQLMLGSSSATANATTAGMPPTPTTTRQRVKETRFSSPPQQQQQASLKSGGSKKKKKRLDRVIGKDDDDDVSSDCSFRKEVEEKAPQGPPQQQQNKTTSQQRLSIMRSGEELMTHRLHHDEGASKTNHRRNPASSTSTIAPLRPSLDRSSKHHDKRIGTASSSSSSSSKDGNNKGHHRHEGGGRKAEQETIMPNDDHGSIDTESLNPQFDNNNNDESNQNSKTAVPMDGSHSSSLEEEATASNKPSPTTQNRDVDSTSATGSAPLRTSFDSERAAHSSTPSLEHLAAVAGASKSRPNNNNNKIAKEAFQEALRNYEVAYDERDKARRTLDQRGAALDEAYKGWRHPPSHQKSSIATAKHALDLAQAEFESARNVYDRAAREEQEKGKVLDETLALWRRL